MDGWIFFVNEQMDTKTLRKKQTINFWTLIQIHVLSEKWLSHTIKTLNLNIELKNKITATNFDKLYNVKKSKQQKNRKQIHGTSTFAFTNLFLKSFVSRHKIDWLNFSLPRTLSQALPDFFLFWIRKFTNTNTNTFHARHRMISIS